MTWYVFLYSCDWNHFVKAEKTCSEFFKRFCMSTLVRGEQEYTPCSFCLVKKKKKERELIACWSKGLTARVFSFSQDTERFLLLNLASCIANVSTLRIISLGGCSHCPFLPPQLICGSEGLRVPAFQRPHQRTIDLWFQLPKTVVLFYEGSSLQPSHRQIKDLRKGLISGSHHSLFWVEWLYRAPLLQVVTQRSRLFSSPC